MLRLIILLILAGGIHSLTPTTAMATAPADSTRITLRIMSFNLRYGTVGDGENAWEFRRQLVRDTILAFSPDVLGTQECLAFQAEFLQGQFPDYGFVGAGRDDGDRAGEMCAIFFRRDRYDPLASGHFWLSETPDRPGSKSWDSALPRMVSWVKLRAKGDTSLTFCIFNTHFDHRGRTARRESARLLRRQALAIAQGSPLIFTGDFNAPANLQAKGPYRELISSATPSDPVSDPGFLDTYRIRHPRPERDEGTFNGFTGATTGQRIDWIVVTPHCDVLDAAIVRIHKAGRYPSDHFPVTAVLRMAIPIHLGEDGQ